MRNSGWRQVSGDKLKAPRQGQPFGTASDYAPSNKDIAAQLGALSQQLMDQGSMQARALNNFEERVNDRFTVVQSELLLLRSVTGDHAPRITAVERTTMGKAVSATKWVGVVTLVLSIAAQVAAAYKPSMVGPLETIGQMFRTAE